MRSVDRCVSLISQVELSLGGWNSVVLPIVFSVAWTVFAE